MMEVHLFSKINHSHLLKQPSDMFCKKRCSQKFRKIHKKRPVQSRFFNKVAGLGLQLYQKKNSAQVFSCEFCEISKNLFFIEYLWVTASVSSSSLAEFFLVLTHFMALISFYTPLIYKGSLLFSGGIERDQWHEMD